MALVLYENWESGIISPTKWDYFETIAANHAQVNNGDANIPTKHLEILSSASSNYSTLISNGDVGDGKYIKCGIFRWVNIVSGAPGLCIRWVSSGADNTGYIAVLDNVGSRIFKSIGGTVSLLATGGTAWAESTNHEAEFFQEINGNLVIKRDGIVQVQVINTEVTGNKIGFRNGNAAFLLTDNIYYEDGIEAVGSPWYYYAQLNAGGM